MSSLIRKLWVEICVLTVYVIGNCECKKKEYISCVKVFYSGYKAMWGSQPMI